LQLAPAAGGLGGFAHAALGGFLEVTAHLHFAEDAFPLEFFLEHAQRLLDIVFAHENFNQRSNRLSDRLSMNPSPLPKQQNLTRH
jgi:hypothetical protein